MSGVRGMRWSSMSLTPKGWLAAEGAHKKPCPGLDGRGCLAMTPGGRPCHYDRRTMAARLEQEVIHGR